MHDILLLAVGRIIISLSHAWGKITGWERREKESVKIMDGNPYFQLMFGRQRAEIVPVWFKI